MANKSVSIQVALRGIRPLMFDRYAGDNNTKLASEEKMYLSPTGQLIVPALNLFSLLAAENTKSVCNQFFGKQSKVIGLGIKSYVNIEPFEIPLLDDSGPITFQGWNAQIYVLRHVARLAKGVPNPKERPVVALPWRVEFQVQYIENSFCTLENLRQAITMGGTLGLGTFRPFFGRYELIGWQDITKERN